MSMINLHTTGGISINPSLKKKRTGENSTMVPTDANKKNAAGGFCRLLIKFQSAWVNAEIPTRIKAMSDIFSKMQVYQQDSVISEVTRVVT